MTTRSLDTLEERIQKPGYLLFLVAVLLLLIVGLVDLIDFVHEDTAIIFGRYDVKYFVLLIVYSLATLAWASLLRRPNDDHFLTDVLDRIQKRPTVAGGVLVGLGLVFVATLIASDVLEGLVSTLPAFQVTVLTLTLLAFVMVLFYRYGDPTRPQRWRKIALVVVGTLLLLELVLQALAFVGAYPINLSTPDAIEDYAAYSRVYQTAEGSSHSLTNNFGRYAMDFELLPDTRHVAILGDSFVEALQVSKEQQFGALLEGYLAGDDALEQHYEVLPLGHPNRGPGMYLSEELIRTTITVLEPDEFIIFFDMGSDFQTVDRSGTGYPYFVYLGEGQVERDRAANWVDVHVAEHHVFRGFKGVQPALILRSNLLTFRLIWDGIANLRTSRNDANDGDPPSYDYDINLENGFVFNAAANEEALNIAIAQIAMAREVFSNASIDLRLVTNPVFSEAFYDQDAWNTRFGDSDLLLPEAELRRAAARYDIPFLGLGAYMEAQGLSPADVQSLYFEEGRGHYTPAGHALAAEAIYQCFYAQTLSPESGCDLR